MTEDYAMRFIPSSSFHHRPSSGIKRAFAPGRGCVLLAAALILTACSSVTKPKSDKLLPDSGPTTAELMTGERERVPAFFGNGVQADYLGVPLTEGYAPNSSYSLSHVEELRRDFRRVPNPEITAYVFPHLNDGELPVPGYFTLFKLYERDHYALEQEGYHESP
ncbi:conjugative transfer region lipoprotein family [Cardiobacterium valvarum F0432]|uniref:Conjugative transfer region lipoprotein family n=2 Tax=Cardiobacterium valvarum TaxID=194702 RepID=G9ZG92_9GAMM|nr:conjugative transfer region lipoprotein family [Cardiobacterium valvarum F0432]